MTVSLILNDVIGWIGPSRRHDVRQPESRSVMTVKMKPAVTVAGRTGQSVIRRRRRSGTAGAGAEKQGPGLRDWQPARLRLGLRLSRPKHRGRTRAGDSPVKVGRTQLIVGRTQLWQGRPYSAHSESPWPRGVHAQDFEEAVLAHDDLNHLMLFRHKALGTKKMRLRYTIQISIRSFFVSAHHGKDIKIERTGSVWAKTKNLSMFFFGRSL